MTPFDNVFAQINLISKSHPDKILVGLNDRDAKWHDIYAIDLQNGTRELLWENTQEFMSVGFDWDYTPRYADSSVLDGGKQLWRINGEEVTPWMKIDYEDNLSTQPLIFDLANKRLLFLSTVGRDTEALFWRDWESDAENVIAEHPIYDVSNIIVDPESFEVNAVSAMGAREEWIYISPDVKDDFALLQDRFDGFEFDISGETACNRKWVVVAQKADQPATYFLFDRDQALIQELMSARPDLKPYKLAPMYPIIEKARDGLELHSYLTLPAELEGERPSQPLPMVLDVHGGPWARDIYGYDAAVQWLANRGYAVLQVNYRGSTGFGKPFVKASEKQHAAAMHTDLIDMVEWAVCEGIADKDKVAIMGASYGGYASFVGATFTPDVFCCSVPIVGISNLQTLLETMPPYWAGFDDFIYRSYGDPRSEEGRKLLAERSPIHKVHNIKKPMLIFHGENDVRCKVAESDQIVAAMEAKNIPVTYVVYPDEGHGFAKPENRIAYITIAEAFFAKHLGGRMEPPGEDLDGSSHEFRAGAEFLADLGIGS